MSEWTCAPSLHYRWFLLVRLGCVATRFPLITQSLITVISGPCDDYTPPRQVRVGETFQANGKTKTITVILADRVSKDLPTLGLKAGDFTCTAAESAANIPSVSGKREHTGTWLYIAKCKPVE